MVSIPRTSDTNKVDLSSICNYADEMTPSQTLMTPVGEKDIYQLTNEFEYHNKAIPFITIDEDSSKFKLTIITS